MCDQARARIQAPIADILETIAMYDAIRADPLNEWVPRVKISPQGSASYRQQS